MQNQTAYYKSQLEKYQVEVRNLDKKLFLFSLLRVLVFIVTTWGIYISFLDWRIAFTVALIGIAVFVTLLSKYTNIKRDRDIKRALITINKDEIEIASGHFMDRDQGLEFQDPNHQYCLDIDLFGYGSFFQLINRTSINEGRIKLANALKANHIEQIALRQETIKELAAITEWRQHFSAISILIHVETPAVSIIKWLKGYKPFFSDYFRWIPWMFSIISLMLIALTIVNKLDPIFIAYWLLSGLLITAVYLKRINKLSSNTGKVKDTFRQYALLLDKIENQTFTSKLLVEKQKQIQSEVKRAAIIFKEFSRYLDALDNRNNLFSAILGNGFFLWDIIQSFKIERWIDTYAHKVEDWFDVVSFFDAYNTLGNFAFNHPNYTYPVISRSKTIIKAKALGHPLLDFKKRTNSDLTIDKQQFFIVTGANMAGKSTFLRTVSLHIVMANIGLPVCAESSEYCPIKLITSMRTSDSLANDSSYFFAELTRLKFISDAITEGPYFIVLDEILKGTNSTDKAIGSKKFVEKLIASKATGIIATHDLSLCTIEKDQEAVKNYYFEAKIINNELYFDYKLKQGICKNMNASFLLKKMKII